MRCKTAAQTTMTTDTYVRFAALLFMTKAILTMQAVLTTTELKLLKQ